MRLLDGREQAVGDFDLGDAGIHTGFHLQRQRHAGFARRRHKAGRSARCFPPPLISEESSEIVDVKSQRRARRHAADRRRKNAQRVGALDVVGVKDHRHFAIRLGIRRERAELRRDNAPARAPDRPRRSCGQ